MNPSTRIIDLTVEQLLALLDERDANKAEAQRLPTVVYGLEGIMEIYRCSKSTAGRVLRSGRIDEAVTRISARKFAVNVAKALTLCPNK